MGGEISVQLHTEARVTFYFCCDPSRSNAGSGNLWRAVTGQSSFSEGGWGQARAKQARPLGAHVRSQGLSGHIGAGLALNPECLPCLT